MVGIKGTGMAAFAEILSGAGAVLTGSDVPEQFYTDEILKKLNIVPFTSFEASHITGDLDYVIHSSAYKKEENPELLEAKKLGIPVLLYTEALGAYSRNSFSCAVSGVHGKTSTTGLAGTVLKSLGIPFSVLAGSRINSFNDSCTLTCGHKYFVAETCEYQKHFLSFHPEKIILTSVESDHQDFYPNYESILSAFMQFIELLPDMGEVIYCADDPGASETVKLIYTSRPDLVYTPYGEKATGEFKIKIQGIENERQVFTLEGFPGPFKLRVPGRHNIKNAAAAIALAVSLVQKEKGQVTLEDIGRIRMGLEAFTGAKRRCEILGEAGGVLFMDDYGHHPTAIKTTLAGLREFYPERRLIVDFMSHTYSRTAALLDEFASSFDDADILVLHPIYGSAREVYTGGVNGYTLYEKCAGRYKNVFYAETFQEGEEIIQNNLSPGDLVLTLGAGDNWKVGKNLLEKLKAGK